MYGTATTNSAKLAVKQINDAGGVKVGDKTYTLALDAKDDQGDPTEALNAFNGLTADGVQLVVGSVTSACTAAITSAANAAGVCLITGCSTADSITTTSDYIFRSCFKDSYQGSIAAYYAYKNNYKSVGVIYCAADTYSKGLYDAFTAACSAHGITVAAKQSTDTMVYSHFPRLKERAGQLAGTLSGGEQQMLATGRALMTNPAMDDHSVQDRAEIVSIDDAKVKDKLITDIARGGRAELEMLYRQTSPAVYAYALSILKNSSAAEDVMQDTYVSVAQNAAGYESQGKPMDFNEAVNHIRAYCEKELQSYAAPVSYVAISDLPLTAAGKVDYRALERDAVSA